jgi:antitoxin component of MazEF toxin-antitoxin module
MKIELYNYPEGSPRFADHAQATSDGQIYLSLGNEGKIYFSYEEARGVCALLALSLQNGPKETMFNRQRSTELLAQYVEARNEETLIEYASKNGTMQ